MWIWVAYFPMEAGGSSASDMSVNGEVGQHSSHKEPSDQFQRADSTGKHSLGLPTGHAGSNAEAVAEGPPAASSSKEGSQNKLLSGANTEDHATKTSTTTDG